jgi:hypothetical protein
MTPENDEGGMTMGSWGVVKTKGRKIAVMEVLFNDSPFPVSLLPGGLSMEEIRFLDEVKARTPWPLAPTGPSPVIADAIIRTGGNADVSI